MVRELRFADPAIRCKVALSGTEIMPAGLLIPVRSRGKFERDSKRSITYRNRLGTQRLTEL